jgi:uncharacterized protein
MADSKTAQEPSMEEILSSIRRIIAEDEPGAQPASAADAPADLPPTGDDEDEDDDVLELTEVVGGPAAPLPPVATAPPVEAASPPSPAPAPVPDLPESHAMPAQAIVDSLVSPVAANASTNAFARLAKAAGSDEKRSVAVGGVTVEQLLVDLLTPMLRDWLDKNLPEIVERVVEQEVKKLARRAELM